MHTQYRSVKPKEAKHEIAQTYLRNCRCDGNCLLPVCGVRRFWQQYVGVIRGVGTFRFHGTDCVCG